MILPTSLPVPDNLAQQHSAQLLTVINNAIAEAGNQINFADYMQLCLYYPGLGYYSAGKHKLGKAGDFTTAPELSSLFSRTFAYHIQEVLLQVEQPIILEFGAGTGLMAAAMLTELASINCLPAQYYIIEVSADLRERQQPTIEEHIPHFANHITWLDQIPNDFMGVVLANEVCDAMPVHCLYFTQDTVYERYITTFNNDLHWCNGELSEPALLEHTKQIQQVIMDSEQYVTEVNLAAIAWLASLANTMQQGAIFICDYGYVNSEYYHPQRSEGTLMCYYQQQAHSNPLILPGLQDITAHVNFTSLAQTAVDNGLAVSGFQSQADFLLAGDITKLVETNPVDPFARLQQTSELKQLTHPSAMGEHFKVLTLTKDLDPLLPRCQFADRRYTL